jgi:beta-N-acetylhexosaminidase
MHSSLNIKLASLILVLLLLSGCGISIYDTSKTNERSSVSTNPSNSNDDQNTNDSNSDQTDPNLSSNTSEDLNTSSSTSQTIPIHLDTASIESIIANMTIEEKVAQLFIVDFYAMTNTYQVKTFTEEMMSFLSQYPIGGIIYFAENIESRDQLIDLNASFQKNSSIPLYISIDEEGGLVSRLGNANLGVNHLANASDLSKLSLEEVKASAYTLGLQLKELGFNYDFAPVLDVNTNPDNPVIGDRSFSSDPDIVASYGTAFSRGLQEAGILTSGKHFPGHGDTSTDSHLGITIIDHNMARLESRELIPFSAAIESNISSIMIGHITTPNITGDQLPASLSPYMITSLLREKLGYEGIIITDSLRMQAITDYYEPKDVGLMLLNAGGDIILLPENFEETYKGILDAIEEGILSEDRIDQSLFRILTSKIGL